METTDQTHNVEQPLVDREKVLEVLALVRPYLQSDGGDVELINITEEGIVELRLKGACGTCPSSTYTLKLGIEEQLRQHVPGVKEVVSV
jgi:Fe-S cluster biogenesis protein NfuA